MLFDTCSPLCGRLQIDIYQCSQTRAKVNIVFDKCSPLCGRLVCHGFLYAFLQHKLDLLGSGGLLKPLLASSLLKLSPEASKWSSKVSSWSPKLFQMVMEGVMHVSKGFQVKPKVNKKLFGVWRWSHLMNLPLYGRATKI